MAVVYGLITQQLVTVAGFSLLCLICWYYWTHRKILSAARKLPTFIPALPLIGHGYLVVFGINWMTTFAVRLIKKVLATGVYDKGIFWAGYYPFFLITAPDDVQILLNSTKSFEGGMEQLLLSYTLGNGLITAPAYLWKVTRRHVNALFHPRNLEQLMPVLNLCARDLVASLSLHAGSGQVDIEPHVYPIALKSTCCLIFGPETKVDFEDEKFKNLMAAITRISQLAAERLLKIWLWPDPIFRFLYKKEIKNIDDGCDSFIIEAIESSRKRRQVMEKATSVLDFKDQSHLDNEIPNTYEDKPDGAEQVILEDTYKVLQNNYPDFTEKDLHNEVRTILLGGSESSRITLSSCLLALAAHPHIQDRLYSEIVSVTGAQDSDVTTEDIRAMPYLDQVLKETLRKFIVIPLITRTVQEDLKLSDWTIPAGALVGVLLFGVHFNPKYYPDPEKFDPDRFSPENVASRAKYTFVPFSSGPRNCIGKNYSMLVLKTLLVHVLKRFRLSTTVDIDAQTYIGGVITQFKDGYKVQLDSRYKSPPSQDQGAVLDLHRSFSFLNDRHFSKGRFID